MNRKPLIALLALAGLALSAAGPVRAAAAFVPIDEKKIEEIAKSVAPSVVRVEARNGMRKVATGVVLDKDGSIVTTALISPRDEEISVLTADGKRLKAEFKGFDTQTGLALIQVKDKGLAPIALGRASEARPGAWIGVVGLSPENTPAVTQGIISSVAVDKIRLNVWVVPGSSGSPVVDGEGRMIGLLRGAYTEDQPVVFEFRERQVVGSGTLFSRAESPSSGMALAVPVDIVVSVAADIKKSGKVERGWLGVQVVLDDAGRLVVDQVDAKSPAELAKVREGDVILKVEGKDVTDPENMSREVRGRKPGTTVVFQVEREGKPVDIKVKLGEYTEADARQELELLFPKLFPAPAAPSVPKGKGSEYVSPATPRITTRLRERRRFIGVTIQEMEKEKAAAAGVKDGPAFQVIAIEEDGPAEKAGLKVDDVILKADGRKLEAPEALGNLIQEKKKGDKVKIDLLREKKPLTFEVEITEYPTWPSGIPWPKGLDITPPPTGTPLDKNTFALPRRPGADRWPLNLGTRKFIGVTLQDLTKDLAAYFGVKDGAGLLVAEVEADSPAQKAGLKAGDVILKADGRALGTAGDLSDLVQEKKKGDKIKIDILRDKKPLTIEVEIAEETLRGAETWTWTTPEGAKLEEQLLRKYREGSIRTMEDIGKLPEAPDPKSREKGTPLARITSRSGVYYRI